MKRGMEWTGRPLVVASWGRAARIERVGPGTASPWPWRGSAGEGTSYFLGYDLHHRNDDLFDEE